MTVERLTSKPSADFAKRAHTVMALCHGVVVLDNERDLSDFRWSYNAVAIGAGAVLAWSCSC